MLCFLKMRHSWNPVFNCFPLGQNIQMTAPVVVKVSDKRFWEKGVYTMSFLLPAEYQTDPPKPTDDKVKNTNILHDNVWTDCENKQRMLLVCRYTSTACQTWQCMCRATEAGWHRCQTKMLQVAWKLASTASEKNTKKASTMLLATTGKFKSQIKWNLHFPHTKSLNKVQKSMSTWW